MSFKLSFYQILKNRLLPAIFLLNYLLLLPVLSSAEDYKFKHININDGLSQNAVFAIIKDSKGFMWFGTKDGLNRFDGYDFVIYQHNPFDTTTLSSNYITRLYEDSRGFIWVGTLDGGLNVYNRKENLFHRIHLSVDSISNGIEYEIKAITEDNEGNIWVGTFGNGLFCFKLAQEESLGFTTKHYINEPQNTNSIISNKVVAVHSDKNGFLWLGTVNGLNRLDIKSGKFTKYSIKTKNKKAPEYDASESISSIYEAKNGALWLGAVAGLVEFDRTNGTYLYFPNRFDINRYTWGEIKAIDGDADGNLWLATPSELMKFNVDSKTYISFTPDPFNPQAISFNIISSVYIDNTGILWIGTVGMGIDYYDPNANRFQTFNIIPDKSSRTEGFSIKSVLEDDKGDIWLSADVLYKWERQTGKVKSYEGKTDIPTDFGNAPVFSMIQSKDGSIWTATSDGIFCYNPNTGIAKRFNFNPNQKNGIPQKEVYTVYEDSDERIWFATENYLGWITDTEKGISQFISYNSGPSFSEQVRPVIFQDFKKQIWLGTKLGLYRLNEDQATFKVYKNQPEHMTTLSNNLIKSICSDPLYPERYLWIGTAGGLNRLDTEEGTFVNFLEADGLPNNVIYGILPDGDNNLWLSTNKGLSRFNPQAGTFRNYSVSNGLQSNEFNTGAYFKSKSGELFFGGIKGLNYFHPSNIKHNTNLPNVVLTKIKLGDKEITNKSHPEYLDKSVEVTKQIVLSHKDDIVMFEFAALEYSAPEKNSYAYMLENFNDTWINTNGMRSATFTHLPSGEYIFRVKAANNDGVWNEEGLAVRVVVKPPWRATWLAYIVYALSLGILIFLMRRYEVNRIKLRNQLEIEKVSADSLRQIDTVKSQFFTNISHEFRTPLTLILGQVESVMSSEIGTREKTKLQVANRNARRLLTLINQLLDLSKLEAGNMELELSQYNIVSFLKNILYSFESMANSKKVALLFESESENIQVLFDLEKIEKVFFNLVSNAMKYTGENGKVTINVKTIDSRDVLIRVEDTGTGIPEKYIPFIFNRFYQVESSSTRNYEGTGIGLALVKELIDLHKGTVTVESKEGKGTVFQVKLAMCDKDKVVVNDEVTNVNKDLVPVYYQEKGVNELTFETEEGIKPEKDNREIVLVVEDNKDVRSYIREQLEEFYQVLEAENGEVGMVVALEVVPDLIVTDLMMPKVSGFELCKTVRNDERTSHIPIIILTAKAGFDDKIEGLEIGIDDYITKPFSAKELKLRVRNLINQRKLLRGRFKSATVIKPSEVTAISIDQVFLDKVIKTIEANFENQHFTPESLAESVNMSVSQLNRKLNALIEQPAGQLMRSLRLQRAADLLKQNAGTVSEICYQLDFNDPAYFSRAFKKQFGCSPSEFIKN